MDKIVNMPHCGFDMSLVMILVVSHVEGFLFQNRALTGMYVQDAMDLVAGHYIVSRGTPSPFQLNGFESLAVSISLLPVFGCYALLLRGMCFRDL
jgi:hypothetical protein